MPDLTPDQIEFLFEQDIPLKYVFDADGFSKREYRPLMKELNKLVAFNFCYPTSCCYGFSVTLFESRHP